MPRKGRGGKGRTPGHDRPEQADRGGMGTETLRGGRPDAPGRSEWSPGHLKKAAGAGSARDYAPGHDGEPSGQEGLRRGQGQGRAEAPEADALDREG